MQLVYKFNIKNNKKLEELCKLSNNLYNQANYIIRQEFINNKKYLNYNSIEKIVKNLPEEYNNYRKLKIQTSQQILRLLDKNWKSFFKSIKDYSKNRSKYLGKPNLPKYKKKNSKNLLIYTNQNCQIKNNKFLILSKDIKINIPEYKNKDFSFFNQVRILPKFNYFEIEIIYTTKEENKNLNYDLYSGIDLGLNNLISFTSLNKSFIFDGKVIKSVNQHYNKFKSKLQNNKGFNNNKINKLCKKRKNIIRDSFHKISRCLINYCITHKIGNIIIGKNDLWKKSINLGKRNNQNFVSVPYENIINLIIYKANLVGIKVTIVNESYTSKCDGLALEDMKHQEKYLGKRICRGLFQSSINKLINADIHASFNIIRKVIGNSHEFINEIINSRVLFNPIKIRISDYQSFNKIYC